MRRLDEQVAIAENANLQKKNSRLLNVPEDPQFGMSVLSAPTRRKGGSELTIDDVVFETAISLYFEKWCERSEEAASAQEGRGAVTSRPACGS